MEKGPQPKPKAEPERRDAQDIDKKKFVPVFFVCFNYFLHEYPRRYRAKKKCLTSNVSLHCSLIVQCRPPVVYCFLSIKPKQDYPQITPEIN
jgi:hypothetical protein